MSNPWEEISLDDYEKHMSLDSVRQLQTMNSIMQEQFSTYPAEAAMVLGIAGGNGLEHVRPEKFRKVYGVDINADYLRAVSERYTGLSGVLECLRIDLVNETEKLPQTQLLIANLLIEYIGCGAFQKAVLQTAPEYVSCVIQINTDEEQWVSESPYLHAFDRLDEVHHQMEGKALTAAMDEIGYSLILQKSYPLPNGKELVRLDFKKDDFMIYGAALDDNKTLDEIIKAISDVYEQYNWLITDHQIFSNKYEDFFANKEYVWLTGTEFRKIAESNDLYAIWCVASAFPKNIILDDILKYELPYANGNTDFWADDIKLQTPLSELEIVIFDGSSCFIISKHKAQRDLFLENITGSYDLIENNRRTNAIAAIITDEVKDMQEYIDNNYFVWHIYHAIFNKRVLDTKYEFLLEKCRSRLKSNGLL